MAGFTTAGSGGRLKTSSGWVMKPLVELVVARHQHGQRRLAPRPARPACCHIEAMVPGNPLSTHGVEPADVDAELEGGGGDHARRAAR